MASLTVELSLKVKYVCEDDSLPDEQLCHEQLKGLVQYAANRGLLSGDSELLVDDYRFSVNTIGVQQ